MKLPIPKGKPRHPGPGRAAGPRRGRRLRLHADVGRTGRAAGGPGSGPGQLGPMLALDDQVINLSTTTPRRLQVRQDRRDDRDAAERGQLLRPARRRSHQGGDDRARAATQTQMPLLLDAVGSVGLRPRLDARSDHAGRAGQAQDRAAGRRSRRSSGDDDVIDVFFTDFVMQ